MKVVILCGGKGTRIRNVSEDLPKPMVRIGDDPILWHIMQGYAHFGHKEFVLCLGYKGEIIKEYFLNLRTITSDFTLDFSKGGKVIFHDEPASIDWKITFAETGLEMLTGSRLARVAKRLGEEETFMLTYGDGVSDIDLDALLDFHRSHGKLMTVSGVRPPSRFGEIDHDLDGRVWEFNEKPQATGGRISGGFFVCRRGVLDYLDPHRNDEVFESGPMQRLAADGELMMYAHDGFWQCMDTSRDYLLLSELYSSGKAPWTP